MGLSIRAYARHRGISHVAVMKAIESGRITQETDGTIDANKADAQWEQNTIQPHKLAELDKTNHTSSDSSTAGESRRVTPEVSTPPLSTGSTSLLQARTVNEVVKVQTNKIRLAQLKGELVDRPQAIAHVFKLARAERDAWLNWPARISAQLAAQLGVDPHTLHVALETAVHEHLQELGELRPQVD